VEEVLDPTLVTDEPEPFVDEQSCDCPGWHNPKALRPTVQPLVGLEKWASLGSTPEECQYSRGQVSLTFSLAGGGYVDQKCRPHFGQTQNWSGFHASADSGSRSSISVPQR